MNRTSIGLAILLALSLAVNAALLGRRTSPAPSLPASAAARPAGDVATTSDARALEAERRKVELLETRVRELEAEKRVLAESGPAPDRLGLLRAKLRRAAKLFDGDPNAWYDPEHQLDYSDASLDVQRISHERLRDPKAYQELLRLIYDMALENPPLPEAQRTLVGKIFDDLAAAVDRVNAGSAGERLLKELELEGEALEKLSRTLGPERVQTLRASPLLNFANGLNANMQWVQGKDADEQLLSGWGQIYGLDAAQKESARPLARRLAEELERLSARDPASAYLHGGTPESYAFHREALRAQLDILRQIESGWSVEQRERFRTKAPRIFTILPHKPFQVQTTEENENP